MATLKDAKKTIRELADLLGETDLTEIEVEQDGLRIRVARAADHFATVPTAKAGKAPAPAPAPPAEAPPPEAEAPFDPSQDPGCVKSPMVGTVYIAPEPGTAPFVQPGDAVKKGQALMIVEAMKVMNPITAHRDGAVKEIFVQDKQPVEYDQPLLLIG